MTAWHERVPKDPIGNLAFRRAIDRACKVSREARLMLLQICSESVLFWVNAFCWTLDPRKLCDNSASIGARLPFITWDYQDRAFLTLEKQLQAGQDLLIEKSRDMGASWICCTWMAWRWLFRDFQSFLLVSRKADLVEGDDDSLMAHIDFILEGLPKWMLSPDDYDDTHMYLKHFKTGSAIEGEATVANVGRGGRRTAILLDEFAAFEGGGYDALSATADTTRCRIMNSTPKGTANAFFAQRQKGTTRLTMHWSMHPEKRRGLYLPKAQDRFDQLDANFDYAGYQFRPEVPRGTFLTRSPWYDAECTRRAHAWEIAQELDIDYQGSNYPFFDPRTLDQLKLEFCRAPDHTGRIVKGGVNGHERHMLHRDRNGPVRLWCTLDGDGRPLPRGYIVGCDVSHGTGASSSVATVVDEYSGEKVAELAGNQWGINQFAELVDLLCGFFTGADGTKPLLIWEATGPGRTFGKVIVEELKYPRFYVHSESDRVSSKPTQKYGWYSSIEGKRDLLQTYRELLVMRLFLNPSEEALQEAGFYVFVGNTIEYQGPDVTSDPGNKGANHGDRVIADALCAKLLFERKGGRPSEQKPQKDAPVLSVAWRLEHFGKKEPGENKCLLHEEW